MLKSILKVVAIAALVVAGAEIVSEAIKETSVDKTEDDNVIDITVKFSKNIFEKGWDKFVAKFKAIWGFIKDECGWFKSIFKRFETNHPMEASDLYIGSAFTIFTVLIRHAFEVRKAIK